LSEYKKGQTHGGQRRNTKRIIINGGLGNGRGGEKGGRKEGPTVSWGRVGGGI